MTEVVPKLPRFTESALGVGDSEKSPSGVTTSVTVVECTTFEELMPLMVMVKVPSVAELPAVIVRVEPPGAPIELGENDAVSPLPSPAAESETVPPKLPSAPVETASETDLPRPTLTVAGVAVIVKSG